jgi:hypothetical protein
MCRTIGLQLVVALFLGGVGNFKRWDLAGGSRSLGGGPCGYPVPVQDTACTAMR